ncbi:MAG: CheR family methyltransferase [Planctomycetota bacterium]
MDQLEAIKPIVATSNLEQVSDKELAQFADLIYARTGIRVSPQKKTLLSNRLRRRLRQTSIQTFGDYYQHLKRLSPQDAEWDAFLQEITTHETYLFRDEPQWDWFRNAFLAEIAAAARDGKRTRVLRIWSAACSTGDEPYTAACCIAACLPNLTQWKVQIVGTDIGIGALEQARSAVFGERAMRLTPVDYKSRYFTKARDAAIWQARPALSSMIAFRQHNLLQPLRDTPFDLVFLKNVLIYFDNESKKTVLDHVRSAVRPGGLLVAGAAEGVGELVKDFERLQPWLYRKPA